MPDSILHIFGEGRDLTALQMAARAFVMFFIAVALVRIAGMRAFGRKSAFDIIVAMMLGAILSRAVTGVSPVIPTLAASVTICIIHRSLAFFNTRFRFLSSFLKGDPIVLYKDGMLMENNMRRCDISMRDLEEGLRLAGNVSSLAEVKEVRMERSGKISVVK